MRAVYVTAADNCCCGSHRLNAGALYHRLDLLTALFSAAPAGIVDMTLASVSFHADSAKVALLRMIRLISALALTPGLAKHISGKYSHLAPGDASHGGVSSYSAGELTDMALVADELGADRAKVAAMQLIRVVGVIALYPPLIKILAETL